MKLYRTSDTPKTMQQMPPKLCPRIMPGWMLSAAWSFPGKGSGNAVWLLAWLNCEQAMGHLWVETETFEALHGWPGESLGCSDALSNFF